METAIRKATRLEYKPPKEKHLLTLKSITYENPAVVDCMMGGLEKRLKERSWIISYKVLEIIHYLMREGNTPIVMDVLIKNPKAMEATDIKNKSSAPTTVKNIYAYRDYLKQKTLAFKRLERDFIHDARQQNGGRLRHLKASDGLLKETAALQLQMKSALECSFHLDERNPQITFFAYRMVVDDVLALFQAMNEGVVNILEHYFEMNKSDAKQALDIYKGFAQLTEETIGYLNIAKRLEGDLQMGIPSVKHAPLSLATALEEYLNEDNFDKQTKQPIAPKSPKRAIPNQQPNQQPQYTQQTQFNQQPQQPQFNQQPLQQTQLNQQPLQQTLFNQQPLQQTPFNHQPLQTYQPNLSWTESDPFMPRDSAFIPNNQNINIMVAPVNKQISGNMEQQTVQNSVSSNPFLNMINQQNTGMVYQQNTGTHMPILNSQNTGILNQQNTGALNPQNTGMFSQHNYNQKNTGAFNQSNALMLPPQITGPTFNAEQPSYQPNRYSTLPSFGSGNSSNPFRSISSSNNSNMTRFSTISYSSPSKQTSLPVQPNTHRSNNPFAPMTPPLTPSRPL